MNGIHSRALILKPERDHHSKSIESSDVNVMHAHQKK